MDLVFSDIHADIEGLQTILNVAFSADFESRYGAVSRIINLGDVLERGTSPKQVLQRLLELSKSYPVISVMGNHDEGFLYKRFLSGSSYASIKAHQSLTEQDLEFFRQHKDGTFGEQYVVDEKNKLICVHGGPVDPTNISQDGNDPWLYQRTWQRLSESNQEFFSYYGYHYRAESAFREARKLLNNFVILCGHQHVEAAMGETKNQVTNLWAFKHQTENIGSYELTKREIRIEKNSNYLIRLGLGGPQGDHNGAYATSHFGIIQHDCSKIILFGVNKLKSINHIRMADEGNSFRRLKGHR